MLKQFRIPRFSVSQILRFSKVIRWRGWWVVNREWASLSPDASEHSVWARIAYLVANAILVVSGCEFVLVAGAWHKDKVGLLVDVLVWTHLHPAQSVVVCRCDVWVLRPFEVLSVEVAISTSPVGPRVASKVGESRIVLLIANTRGDTASSTKSALCTNLELALFWPLWTDKEEPRGLAVASCRLIVIESPVVLDWRVEIGVDRGQVWVW